MSQLTTLLADVHLVSSFLVPILVGDAMDLEGVRFETASLRERLVT